MKKVVFLVVMVFLYSFLRAEEKTFLFLKAGYADFSKIGKGYAFGFLTGNEKISLEITPFWGKDDEIKNISIPIMLISEKNIAGNLKFGGGIGYQILLRSLKSPYGTDKREYSGPLARIKTSYQFQSLQIEIGYQYSVVKSNGILTRIGRNPLRPGEEQILIFPNSDGHPLSNNRIRLAGFFLSLGIKI